MTIRYLGSLLVAFVSYCCIVQPLFCSGSAVSLQDAEGQHLHFLRLSINAALFGPFALVENEMVFQNPEGRTMEGRFSFTLPTTKAGVAAPSRWAMEINGELMEGEVVETMKARRVYREILHEARDPALLEQSQGNVFKARVFPIRPYAVVRLFLSYTLVAPLQAMRRAIVFPVQGLPEIHDFDFSVVVGGLGTQEFSATCSMPGLGDLPGVVDNATGYVRFASNASLMLTPDSDVVLDIRQVAGSHTAIAVDGGQLVSIFNVGNNGFFFDSSPFFPRTWLVYIDTSASTADTHVVRLPMIEALLDSMPECEVEVFGFDIEVVQLRARGAKDSTLGSSVRQELAERLALGATDIESLLDHVNTHARSDDGRVGVLILSDFIATASERSAAPLAQLLEDRSDRVVELGVLGTKFDSSVGTAVAGAGGGRIVRIPLTSQNVSSITTSTWVELTRPVGRRAIPQVTSGWVWPSMAYDLHDGDEVIVFSGGASDGGLTMSSPKLAVGSGDSADMLVTGAVLASAPAFGTLLAAEATRARLDVMETSRQLAINASVANGLKKQMVQLSEQKRVMCPHTAFIVLETEEDYVRFDVRRDSLSPVLVVSESGVELRQRGDISLEALPTGVPTSTTSSTRTVSLVNTTNSSVADDDDDDNLNPTSEPSAPTPQPTAEVLDDNEEDNAMDNKAEHDYGGDMESGAVRSACFSKLSSPWGVWCGLVYLVFLLSGCDDSVFGGGEGGGNGGTWADPEKAAEANMVKYGADGPQERRRDFATEYASALWTKRKALELKNFSIHWMTWDPANSLVYEYLSKAAQHLGDPKTALRAATSIVEIKPRDSEQLLRGAWIALTLTSHPAAAGWARRFAQLSLDERKDNPNTYRVLGFAAWKDKAYDAAYQAYADGLAQEFHGRYGDIRRVYSLEVALLLNTQHGRELNDQEIQQLPGGLPSVYKSAAQSLKNMHMMVAVSWLTDANDVDLHVEDPGGAHCYHGNQNTAGLSLFSDQTEGLGPEVITLDRKKSGAYRIGVKYYSSGSMGASRGVAVVSKISNGKLDGDHQIEVFALPPGFGDILPVATVEMK